MRRHADLNDVLAPALRLKYAGFVHERPYFKIGPRKISEFGIAFLYSGKGWVVQAGVRHALSGGELFLIFPHVRYVIAASHSRWRIYYANFVSPALAPALRRSGITPRHYLRRDCDRDAVKEICDSLVAAGMAGPTQNLPTAAARVWDILALLHNPSRLKKPKLHGPIEATRRYLEKHPTGKIRIATLAAMAHLSPFHFIRQFRHETGFSPHQYQINQRILAARRLLIAGKSVKETAHELAYEDLFYFSRLFKRKTGVAPSQYVHLGLL